MTNIVHSLPYPSLEDCNLSFPNGHYDVEVKSLRGGTSVQVVHILNNASFIQDLLDMGYAKYGYLLAVPLTGYRRLSLSSNSSQIVEWDIGVVGEPPILRPIIVTSQVLEHSFQEEDEVAKIWINKRITIPKGARLARGKYLRSVSSFQSLLDIRKNEKIQNGCFLVQPDENNGFRFSVDVAPDVFDFLSRPSDAALYRSIGVHMVSRCFSILREDQSKQHGEEKWNDYSNLRMLSGILKERELPHWSEENFRPELVALQLHPLILPRIIGED